MWRKLDVESTHDDDDGGDDENDDNDYDDDDDNYDVYEGTLSPEC